MISIKKIENGYILDDDTGKETFFKTKKEVLAEIDELLEE